MAKAHDDAAREVQRQQARQARENQRVAAAAAKKAQRAAAAQARAEARARARQEANEKRARARANAAIAKVAKEKAAKGVTGFKKVPGAKAKRIQDEIKIHDNKVKRLKGKYGGKDQK